MTDKIIISRKEIEALIPRHLEEGGYYLRTKFVHPLRALLDKAEVSEPVADAINERSRLGYTVVKVIGKLDEIIENTQEVEIDDFLHIAVPIDMWGELQESLEDMPKRAYLYTSPPDPSAKIAELEAEIARLKAIT